MGCCSNYISEIMARSGNVIQHRERVLNLKYGLAHCHCLVNQAVRCGDLAAIVPSPCNCCPACRGWKAVLLSNREHSTQSTLRDVWQHVTEPLQPSTFCRWIRHERQPQHDATQRPMHRVRSDPRCLSDRLRIYKINTHLDDAFEFDVLLSRYSGSDGTQSWNTSC